MHTLPDKADINDLAPNDCILLAVCVVKRQADPDHASKSLRCSLPFFHFSHISCANLYHIVAQVFG